MVCQGRQKSTFGLRSVFGSFLSRIGPKEVPLSSVLHSLLLFRHELLASAKTTSHSSPVRAVPAPPLAPDSPPAPAPLPRQPALREAPAPPQLHEPADTLRASLRPSVSFAIPRSPHGRHTRWSRHSAARSPRTGRFFDASPDTPDPASRDALHRGWRAGGAGGRARRPADGEGRQSVRRCPPIRCRASGTRCCSGDGLPADRDPRRRGEAGRGSRSC